MFNINQVSKLAIASHLSIRRSLVTPQIRYNFVNIKDYMYKDQKKKLENFDNYNKQYTGTVEQIVKKRQQQHKYLEIESEKKKDLDIFVEAYSDTVIEFKLYGEHFDYKTQTIDAILNYYQVSYTRMFNPLYHERIRAQFGDSIKSCKFPLLRINISLEPAKFLELEQMEPWLIDQGFIILPKHRTHSAWATQGIEFAEKQMHEALNRLFWSPALTFQLYWKSHSKSYTEQSKRALVLRVARIQFVQIITNLWKNLRSISKDIEAFKKTKQDVVKLVNDWKEMLEENDYHGGINPDEADFAMYGVIMAKYNSQSFQRFIQNEWPASVRRWLIRMQQNCQYEKRDLYN
ncbi:hypothetical protein ABPG72_015177 [Tetrahymena utriculariae]